MSAKDGALPRLDPTAVAILESLNQHRLLSTGQVHELHMPTASRRWAQHQLRRLGDAGLAASVLLPGRLAIWHLSERGFDAVEAISNRAEMRHYRVSAEQAAGPLLEHTIGVNEIGLAFLRAARQRGEEFGPFDWLHEIAHSLGPPPGRRTGEQLISDAVLTYQLAERDGSTSIAYRFVEFDRANRSAADLARRLGRYARLYRRTVPAENPQAEVVALWERLYPVFPAVLVVLAGRPDDRLEGRRRTVLALCRQDPDLRESPEVEISICLLADLVEQGPFARIFRSVAESRVDVDWLGEGG
jgi:DNA-binding transcriptional ArsR family regulator